MKKLLIIIVPNLSDQTVLCRCWRCHLHLPKTVGALKLYCCFQSRSALASALKYIHVCFFSADRHLSRPASLPTLHSAGAGGVVEEDSYSETLRPEERLQYRASLTSPLRRRTVSRLTIIPDDFLSISRSKF